LGADTARRFQGSPTLGACIGLSAAVAAVCAMTHAGQGSPKDVISRLAKPLHDPHFVVVKSSREMYVFEGASLRRAYPVRIGPETAARRSAVGRLATPIGRFQVCFKRFQSPFRRFIGLGYPNAELISDAFSRGLLSPGEWSHMRSDLASGRCPTWRSVLGGGIGLHGRAEQSPFTRGCIALSDRHIDEVFNIIRTGDVVEILP